MEITIESSEDEYVRIMISGGITSAGLAEHDSPLEDLLGSEVFSGPALVNLRDSDYIDSSGIGWLLTCQKRFRESGGRMVLHSVAPSVMNVIRIMNLHAVLELADNEAEAARRISGQEK